MISAAETHTCTDAPVEEQQDSGDLPFYVAPRHFKGTLIASWLCHLACDLFNSLSSPLRNRAQGIAKMILAIVQSSERKADEVGYTLGLVEQFDPEGLDLALDRLGAVGLNAAEDGFADREHIDRASAVVRMMIVRSLSTRTPATLAMADAARAAWRRARVAQAAARQADTNELAKLAQVEAVADRQFTEIVSRICSGERGLAAGGDQRAQSNETVRRVKQDAKGEGSEDVSCGSHEQDEAAEDEVNKADGH